MRAVAALSLLFAPWLLTLNSLKAEVLDVTCYSGGGNNYRGTVATTTSGRTCQSWSVQTPHRHGITPENYPCSGLENNYCRNPNYPDNKKPWCYTTDPHQHREFCDIPRCVAVPQPEPFVPEMSCFTACGLNYRGTVSTTSSGRTCQRWSDQTPHSHGATPERYPHAGLENNYCRNPDGEVKPFCVTTDPQKLWEFCDIPRCVAVPQPESDDVRLVGGASRCTGTLEVRHQGDWKPAADFTSSWNLLSSSVVCRQLNCGSAVNTTSPGSTRQPVWWITASCVGSESSLRECVTMKAASSRDRVEVTCSVMFSQCGRPEPRHTVKVINGRPTHPGVHPWQVSVQSRATGSSEPFRHTCGGVLVESCLVLTAAHCISPNRSKDMRVVLGGVYLKKRTDSEQFIPVVRAIVHDDYRIVNNPDGSFSEARSDIALLELNFTHPESQLCAVETRYVKTVCLPERQFTNETECVVSGWGHTGKGRISNRLMEGQAPLIPEEQCRAVHEERLNLNMICAGFMQEARAGACQGDSGGPLVCVQDGVHYLAGLVSWGPPCDNKVNVGVYANVYRFLEWINTKDRIRDYVYDYDEDATSNSTSDAIVYDYTKDD